MSEKDRAAARLYKTAERQRKRAKGLEPVEVWVPADRKDDIRKVAESMRKEAEDAG